MIIDGNPVDFDWPRANPASGCPACGGTTLPVVYGLPAPEASEAAARGEVVLGGCVDFANQPACECTQCGATFGAASLGDASDADKRLHRLLKRDLGAAVHRNERGTWTTTSGLPHEIRLHMQSGVTLVRVSAGVLVDVNPSHGLLAAMNMLNTVRALMRYIAGEGKVLVVTEMPLASVRKGDLEKMVSGVFCCARIDAPVLAKHGGTPVVSQVPPQGTHDFARTLHTWSDVLRASGTASAAELTVWLDDLVGCDCWLDVEDWCLTVAVGTTGTENHYPFTLEDLRRSAYDLASDADEDDDDDAVIAEVDVLEARLLARFPMQASSRPGLTKQQAVGVFREFGYPARTAAAWASDGWLLIDRQRRYFLTDQGLGWIHAYLPDDELSTIT